MLVLFSVKLVEILQFTETAFVSFSLVCFGPTIYNTKNHAKGVKTNLVAALLV